MTEKELGQSTCITCKRLVPLIVPVHLGTSILMEDAQFRNRDGTQHPVIQFSDWAAVAESRRNGSLTALQARPLGSHIFVNLLFSFQLSCKGKQKDATEASLEWGLIIYLGDNSQAEPQGWSQVSHDQRSEVTYWLNCLLFSLEYIPVFQAFCLLYFSDPATLPESLLDISYTVTSIFLDPHRRGWYNKSQHSCLTDSKSKRQNPMISYQ